MIDKIPYMAAVSSGGKGVTIQRQEVANGTGRIAAPFP